MARVLVIDDEDFVLAMAVRMLEGMGHDVRGARESTELSAILADFPADVVITDLFLADRSGYEVIEDLAARDPRPRIIAMTSGSFRLTGDMADPTGPLAKAQEAGADCVLAKPLTKDALGAELDRLLA